MVLPYCTIFVPGGVFFTLAVSWGLQTGSSLLSLPGYVMK